MYYNAQRQDDIAKDMYRGLLFKWYNRTGNVIDNVDPTNNCLAIARSVYCAHAFPKCVDYIR